jgi:hypothetical protein
LQQRLEVGELPLVVHVHHGQRHRRRVLHDGAAIEAERRQRFVERVGRRRLRGVARASGTSPPSERERAPGPTFVRRDVGSTVALSAQSARNCATTAVAAAIEAKRSAPP